MKSVFKKLSIFFILFVGLGFAQVTDKTEYKLVLVDSIANSMTKTAYVSLDGVEAWDSIAVGIVQYGACSMDSVIAWSVGYKGELQKGNYGSINASIFGSTTNIALAADQTTTAGITAYSVATTYLTKANLKNYPDLKLTITAKSSGNTASQTAQRVGIVVIFYRL